ncbi:hypothetical protein SS50377_26380 [Spironucleus salmonicida]|uniref:Uncharacterized protein n=1 Tax=Spironucleus salmonicida TaxID=348837 RepID=V6LU39_9EUKA|nr:hypothetical protein SS50377_26380 [Spironucleus salmonicida]|eukprot:EST47753.1 Hypothetical protein SS50377_12152 [Spironucleus salmonicida]
MFSVLGSNIKKATSNDEQVPDDSMINAVYVFYTGQVDKYSQDQVVENIIKVLIKGHDLQQLKAIYLLFMILIKCEQGMQCSPRPLNNLGYQVLKQENVLLKLNSLSIEVDALNNCLITAMRYQKSLKKPIQDQFQESVYVLKTISIVATLNISQQIQTMITQILGFVIKMMSQILQSLAGEYKAGNNIKWAQNYVSEFRICICPILTICKQVHVSAEFQDVPDLIEDMVKGRFTGTRPVSISDPPSEYGNFAPKASVSDYVAPQTPSQHITEPPSTSSQSAFQPLNQQNFVPMMQGQPPMMQQFVQQGGVCVQPPQMMQQQRVQNIPQQFAQQPQAPQQQLAQQPTQQFQPEQVQAQPAQTQPAPQPTLEDLLAF